ncbi:MAG: hypothetical protein AAGA28_05150 [Pseudomonadota bacterium]
MRRAFRIVLVLIVALGLFYISRFWPFELWSRQSVLGQWGLRPRGGLLQFWLRGTPFAQFELIVWAVLAFVSLSLTEKLVGWITPTPAK